MMRFSWSKDGFDEVRQSAPVARMVASAASRVASQAGRGYVSSAQPGKPRPAPKWNKIRGRGYAARYRAIVYPESWRAIRDNAKNNTLVKLTGGGW